MTRQRGVLAGGREEWSEGGLLKNAFPPKQAGPRAQPSLLPYDPHTLMCETQEKCCTLSPTLLLRAGEQP